MAVSLAKDQEKFVVRLPLGMRDRIKEAADRNGRSMNAEIVQALEQMYPPQPSLDEVLEHVHYGIALAKNGDLPYRKILVDSLEELGRRIASGMEFDQFRSSTHRNFDDEVRKFQDARARLHRASEHGVQTSDLEREIASGMFNSLGQNRIQSAILRLRDGKTALALKHLNLTPIRFANPDEAFEVLEKALTAYYEENWGDPRQLRPAKF